MMNNFFRQLKGIKIYLAVLLALTTVLGIYTVTGRKISGSTSTEKWTPDGKSSHSQGNSHFYHK